MYAYNAIAVLLALALFYLFITAIVDGLIAFKGAATFILLFVIFGMIFKAICYASGVYEDEEEDNSGEQENN